MKKTVSTYVHSVALRRNVPQVRQDSLQNWRDDLRAMLEEAPAKIADTPQHVLQFIDAACSYIFVPVPRVSRNLNSRDEPPHQAGAQDPEYPSAHVLSAVASAPVSKSVHVEEGLETGG